MMMMMAPQAMAKKKKDETIAKEKEKETGEAEKVPKAIESWRVFMTNAR